MTNESAVLKTPNVLSFLNIARATLYELIKNDPTFPRPFKLGTRDNGWLRRDVESWLDTKAAAAQGVAA